jgi:hypothetical protein
VLARVVLSALICVVPAAQAADLGITAVVARSARVTLLDQPSRVIVTREDVARGFVDLPPGPRLDVRSNSREGLAVAVVSTHPLLGVELRGGHTSLVLPGGVRSLALNYRVLLAPHALPGTYAWPGQIIATPL